MSFAREVSSQVMYLHQDEIAERGPLDGVLQRPRNERLRAFLTNSLK